MLIDYLYSFRACRCPTEANTVLIIHPDAVLPLSVATECLHPISRWDTEILERCRNLELPQLPTRDRFYVHKSIDPLAARKCLRVSALERNDHVESITCRVIIVKRDYQRSCCGVAGRLTGVAVKNTLQNEEHDAEEVQEAAQQNEYMKDRMDILLLLADHIED